MKIPFKEMYPEAKKGWGTWKNKKKKNNKKEALKHGGKSEGRKK